MKTRSQKIAVVFEPFISRSKNIVSTYIDDISKLLVMIFPLWKSGLSFFLIRPTLKYTHTTQRTHISFLFE